jgi:glutamyl-tRNA synthetase
LSKRFGASSVEEFREQGILPPALFNYLALLGWSPGDDREILSREEMAALFTVERLNASPAVFDPEKLSWVNAQYLSSLPVDEVLRHAAPFLAAEGLADVDRDRLRAATALHRGRCRTLKDLAAAVAPYFRDVLAYDPDACRKFLADPDLPEHLEVLAARFAAGEPFHKETLEAALRALAEERGLKAGALIHPTRMALTAAPVGPPLFDVVELMGREAVSRHFPQFVEFLRAGDAPLEPPIA